MGLGTNYNADVVVGDVGGVDGCGGKCFGSVSCSICLELVGDNGDRSWAKLQCGHQFHLDCIGSAFNIKGAMQCPNCRKIEKGQWLYANGSRSSPEFNMDDWAHDEDLYDLSYSDMSFGVHWCPFDSIPGYPSTFEQRITGCDILREGELSSAPYHDLLGQHAVSSSSSSSSSSHPCPYVTYAGPIHNPSSSNSSESVSDNLPFNNYWNGHSSAPIHAFPPMDLNYHSWEHDQSSAPPVTTQRQARNFSLPQSGSFVHHPFLAGQSSSVRPPSPVIPPYPGSNARARNRDQALQAYYHHQQPATRSANRRSHRSMGQIGPGATSSSDNRPAGHHYTPPETNGRSFQETENNRFHAWESDHLPSFSLNQLDRDFGWGNSYEGAGGSDHGVRPSHFRQRHESERNWW